jgi:hypothetical protein
MTRSSQRRCGSAQMLLTDEDVEPFAPDLEPAARDGRDHGVITTAELEEGGLASSLGRWTRRTRTAEMPQRRRRSSR